MKCPSTAVLVLLCLFIPVVRLQEETPTPDTGTDMPTDGLGAAFDEIKDLLTTIKSKTNRHLIEFRAFRDQMKEDISSMKSDISSLTDVVASLNESVASVNDSVKTLEHQLRQNEQNTTAGLDQLQTSHLTNHFSLATYSYQMNTKLVAISNEQSSLRAQLGTITNTLENQTEIMQAWQMDVDNGFEEQIERKMDALSAALSQCEQQLDTRLTQLEDSLHSTMSSLETDLASVGNRVCAKLQNQTEQLEELQVSNERAQEMNTTLDALYQQTATGFSELETSVHHTQLSIASAVDTLNTTLHSVFDNCSSTIEVQADQQYTCGDTGGWRRVVYLDMTDNTTTCPSGWQLTAYSKRTCGRATNGRTTCNSVIFPVSGGPYTRVCGRIKAYQYGHTDAFEAYHRGDMTTIDGAYVSGVSLTHGSPRQHIWTFAAGAGETLSSAVDACPCDASISISIPGFVGTDYFCESGRNTATYITFNPDDPLWDGQDCISSSSCCSFNTPPYFTKRLPTPTDDIEARICLLDANDDSPVELIELYVQ